jgi:hypothetical protein
MSSHHEDLRDRLLGRCTSLDSAALADELFDAVVVAAKRVLARPTVEVEALLADLRVDLARRIEKATRGTANVAEVIDDAVTNLMGTPRG